MAGCQSAAAGPHSLLVQLSALHRFRIQVDVAVLVLALAKVIAHFTTGSVFQLVPVAAIGLFTWMFGGGVVVLPAGVLVAVIATAAAWVVYSWLRRRSGSLLPRSR